MKKLAMLSSIFAALYFIYSTMKEENRRTEEETKARVQLADAERADQERTTREYQNTVLAALSDEELSLLGLQCIHQITELSKEGQFVIWNLVDIAPLTLQAIENAALMGLKMTGAGEFTAPSSLVRQQIDRSATRKSLGLPFDTMTFIASELSDTIIGRVELLTEYRCNFRDPKDLKILKGKSVVIS